MEIEPGCVLPSMKEGAATSAHRNAEETIAASLLGITSQRPASVNLDVKVLHLPYMHSVVPNYHVPLDLVIVKGIKLFDWD